MQATRGRNPHKERNKRKRKINTRIPWKKTKGKQSLVKYKESKKTGIIHKRGNSLTVDGVVAAISALIWHKSATQPSQYNLLVIYGCPLVC